MRPFLIHFRKFRERGRHIDALRAGMRALSASDARCRTLLLFKRVDPHGRRKGLRELIIVVALEKIRDIQSDGTSVAAISACSAGNALLEILRDLEEYTALLRGQRPFLAERPQVVLHLEYLVHPGENDLDARQILQKTEGIRCIAGIIPRMTGIRRRMQRSELRGFTFRKHGQLPSAAGFHDPDTEPVADDDLIFALRVLQGPVEVIELDLNEIELPLVPRQERLEQLRPAVEGESQVPDLPLFLHPQHVRKNVILLALIVFYRPLCDVVQQVEVKIVRPALSERDLEQRDVVDRRGQGMPREFVRDVIALAGIAGKPLRHGEFRFSAQIGIGRVKIVHSFSDREVEHRVDFRLVDLPRRRVRCKPHASETEL